MRDLFFRSLISEDKKRRILASSETMDKQGVRSVIHRHFVCIAREINPALACKSGVKDKELSKPKPYLYVLKEHNSKERKEKFFCRVKGSLYLVHEGRLFLVLFMHSLKISLTPAPQDSIKFQ